METESSAESKFMLPGDMHVLLLCYTDTSFTFIGHKEDISTVQGFDNTSPCGPSVKVSPWFPRKVLLLSKNISHH